MPKKSDEGVPFDNEEVHGFLHMPADGADAGLVLTHGAGSNCGAPLLVAVANAFSAEGIAVLRCDLAFRQKRPKGPPSPASGSADRAGLRLAVLKMRALTKGKVFLGGHSYGGRQASILAADDPTIAEALLLLSYPLHPPSKPDKPRTEHFPKLRTPTIFVHGATDPFGTVEEMELALAMISGPSRLLPIEGVSHDLKNGRFEFAANYRRSTERLRDNWTTIRHPSVWPRRRVCPDQRQREAHFSNHLTQIGD